MQRRTFGGLVASLLFVASMPFSLQAATDSSDGERPETTAQAAVFREGLHIVRPGDTLEKITARYLGSSARWRDNLRLNPEITNPHKISPGQRIRVLLEELPVNGALVSMVSNQVEDRLLPLNWKDAEPNDLLQPDDNLRTLEKSSASLLFPDDTLLVITEMSLVIIGKSSQGPRSVDKTLIEIDQGQADFSRVDGATGPLANGIEVQIGDASMVPKVDADGKLEARARKADTGGAQVMIYSGESQLSAGGAEITVPQGMGSSVKNDGKPPSPPEKLLPAAGGLSPVSASQWSNLRPDFRWDAVDGAESYTVEVCNDPRCASLVARATGLAASPWAPAGDLPLGLLYWRVTATSPSGLDGYPSEATSFETLDGPLDVEAPTLSFRFEDPRANIDEQVIVGPGFKLQIETEDVGSGVESWHPIIDGVAKTAADLDGPWTTGTHDVVIVAVDKAGNQLTSEPIEFFFDDVPPSFSWGLQTVDDPVGLDLVNTHSELDGPSATQRGRQTLSVAGRGWWLDSDFTQVILRPTSGSVRLDGAPHKLGKKRGLWILAEDETCQIIDTVRYELEERSMGGRKGTAVLVVEAIDCVGNRSRIAFPLRSQR